MSLHSMEPRERAEWHEEILTDAGVQQHQEIVTDAGVERRERIVHDLAGQRRRRLERVEQTIWLILGLLEGLIGLRVFLKLIAANPEAPFARFVYNLTELFLAPFLGLTASPSADGSVLEVPALIAMLVYALAAWAVVRLLWIVFFPSGRTRRVTYDRERS